MRVPEIPGLDVTEHGQVTWLQGKPLKWQYGKDRYPRVQAAGKLRYVHALVASAFIGPRPDGQEVRHLDGDRLNPNVANLAYGTRSQNRIDCVQHGTDHNASKTHCANGHEFTEANTYVYKGRGKTERQCRTCRNAYIADWKRRNKAGQ